MNLQSATYKVQFYTLFALIAFAGNSLMCRLALATDHIDPVSFTLIRFGFGFAALFLIVNRTGIKPQTQIRKKPSWLGAFSLTVYGFSFSWAYINIQTGTGALVLFAVVQIYLLGVHRYDGGKLTVQVVSGVAIALGGVGVLVYDDLHISSLVAFVLMALAGVAWGVYTHVGRSSQQPLADSYLHFKRAALISFSCAALASPWLLENINITVLGFGYAALAGAVTSALGYLVWYHVVRQIPVIVSSVAQLLVPVIAAIMGAVFLNEILTLTVLIAFVFVLFGLALVMFIER